MDFRPTRNTLVINYLVTFAIVGLICFLSVRNPTAYYYSPEYNSHGSYGGTSAAQSCKQCHVQAFNLFDEKTCWTSGCHSNFEPDGKLATEGQMQLTKSESSGETRESYGAILAFHKVLPKTVSCEECHPSHKLPQKGKFNHTTLLIDLERKVAESPPKDPSPAGLKAVRADIFHAKAAAFTGKTSCQTCHVGMNEQQPSASVAAALAPAMSVPSPTPVSELLPAAQSLIPDPAIPLPTASSAIGAPAVVQSPAVTPAAGTDADGRAPVVGSAAGGTPSPKAAKMKDLGAVLSEPTEAPTPSPQP